MGKVLGASQSIFISASHPLKGITQLTHSDDTSCTVLPDTMHFSQLLEQQPRPALLSHRPTELITPTIHESPLCVHYHLSTLFNSMTINTASILNAWYSHGISCQ